MYRLYFETIFSPFFSLANSYTQTPYADTRRHTQTHADTHTHTHRPYMKHLLTRHGLECHL